MFPFFLPFLFPPEKFHLCKDWEDLLYHNAWKNLRVQVVILLLRMRKIRNKCMNLEESNHPEKDKNQPMWACQIWGDNRTSKTYLFPKKIKKCTYYYIFLLAAGRWYCLHLTYCNCESCQKKIFDFIGMHTSI